MLHQLKNGNWIALADVKRLRAVKPYTPSGPPRPDHVLVELYGLARAEQIDFDSIEAARSYRDELAALVNAACEAAKREATTAGPWLFNFHGSPATNFALESMRAVVKRAEAMPSGHILAKGDKARSVAGGPTMTVLDVTGAEHGTLVRCEWESKGFIGRADFSAGDLVLVEAETRPADAEVAELSARAGEWFANAAKEVESKPVANPLDKDWSDKPSDPPASPPENLPLATGADEVWESINHYYGTLARFGIGKPPEPALAGPDKWHHQAQPSDPPVAKTWRDRMAEDPTCTKEA